LSVIDTDAATEGDQPVVLPEASVGIAEVSAWSESAIGDIVAVTYNDKKGDERIVSVDFVDAGTFAVTSVVPSSGGASTGVPSVHGGALYYSARNGEQQAPMTIIPFDGSAQTVPVLYQPTARGGGADHEGSTGVVFEPSGERYWVINFGEAWAVDATTNTLIDTDGEGEASPIQMGEQMRAHMMVVSPF
jgi:hypothetical protein